VEKKDAILKVSEAFQQDVAYDRARIDFQTRNELNLEIGDAIELEGTKVTAASVWRGHPSDEGKHLVRIDNLTRKNAGINLGDRVKIRKADVKEARDITLAPLMPEGQRIEFGLGIEKILQKNLLRRPITHGDEIIVPGIAFFGNALPFIVVDTEPHGIVMITDRTLMHVREEAAKIAEGEGPRISYEDIGGLNIEIQCMREMIELPLKHPELFDRMGIDISKGILLHGPIGVGKTLLVKAVANESGANLYIINGPELMSRFYGQSEENLRKIFEEAQKNAPSIIFLDEIDSISQKRSEVHGEVERRIVSQLFTLMDGLKKRGKVFVIGATNIPDMIDPALKSSSRFSEEIKMDVPDKNGRKEILLIHTRSMPINPSFSELYPGETFNEEKNLNAIKEGIKKISVSDLFKNVLQTRDTYKHSKIVSDYLKVIFDSFKAVMPSIIYEKVIHLIADDITNLLPYYFLDDTMESASAEQQINERLATIQENPHEFIKRILKESLLDDIADKTQGLVGADLASLANKAGKMALRRYISEIDLERPIPIELLEKMEVTVEDFKWAINTFQEKIINKEN
jgi:transitional endoplasmic reticulum ATPase